MLINLCLMHLYGLNNLYCLIILHTLAFSVQRIWQAVRLGLNFIKVPQPHRPLLLQARSTTIADI